MPITPTYPGVYIEEVAGGVRTITGVATSITAFVGRAERGTIDRPVTINGLADYSRIFGRTDPAFPMAYAVRDFYLNGGGQAIVVRLYRGATAAGSTAKLTANGLELTAASPGRWGNALRARIDDDVAAEVAASFGLTTADLFNLTVRDTGTGAEESFRNLTIAESPRRVDRVLANESSLVRAALPAAVPAAHADPTAGQDIWKEDTLSEPVDTADAVTAEDALQQGDFTDATRQLNKEGIHALERTDLFNLLCIPPYLADGGVDAGLITVAAKLCEDRRAMLLVDPPPGWTSKDLAKAGVGALGTRSRNAAVFFPRLRQPDPARQNQVRAFVPCGAVAGVFARTDAQRGVWKAPAGLDSRLEGVPELSVPLTDAENGELNPLGINCLRAMPDTGPVVWGSRTLQGADRLASEWKYIPVRRTALFLEESLYRGTQWVVFEPNDEPLWSQIRLNIGAFMNRLFKQGAFQGKTAAEAYFVKCDKETTTQADIDLGIVNIHVGFAPLKPAEFVIVRIQQMAGQAAT